MILKCEAWCESRSRKKHPRNIIKETQLQSNKLSCLKPQASSYELCPNEGLLKLGNDPREHEKHSCSQPKAKPKLKNPSARYSGKTTKMAMDKYTEVSTLKITRPHCGEDKTSSSQPSSRKDLSNEVQNLIVRFENESKP